MANLVNAEVPVEENQDVGEKKQETSFYRRGGLSQQRRSSSYKRRIAHKMPIMSNPYSAIFLANDDDATALFFEEEEEEDKPTYCVFSWEQRWYKLWWYFTVLCSIVSVWYETFIIAFVDVPSYTGDFIKLIFTSPTLYTTIFTAIFLLDMVLQVNLAYTDKDSGVIVTDHLLIAKRYMKKWFFVDVVGVSPFNWVSIAVVHLFVKDDHKENFKQWLVLIQLLKLSRMYRVLQFLDKITSSTSVSLLLLTMIRNFGLVLIWTHFNACAMFFLAKRWKVDSNTWIESEMVKGKTLGDYANNYLVSLYWSVVTFTTVGYGDLSPETPLEQIWGVMYMLCNMAIQAWLIGSITLVVVKGDERTSIYRDKRKSVDRYAKINNFSETTYFRMKQQLKLEQKTHGLSDKKVIMDFPISLQRKVLKEVYEPALKSACIMRRVQHSFLDAYLDACNIEVFSEGVEISQYGSVASDLYLLIEGKVDHLLFDEKGVDNSNTNGEMSQPYENINAAFTVGAFCDNDINTAITQGTDRSLCRRIGSGDFINEIGFFTEIIQTYSIRTASKCKVLGISRMAYNIIADDFPNSVEQILRNLLAKYNLQVETFQQGQESESSDDSNDGWGKDGIYEDKTKSPSKLDPKYMKSFVDGFGMNLRAVAMVQTETALYAIINLIKVRINNQKDQRINMFLSAASHDDAITISFMCEHQNFDPDSSDYDDSTAIMLASKKGNIEVVKKLIENHADLNGVDFLGYSALYEAAKNGHDKIIDELVSHGAKLCMDDRRAASLLCQVVLDGDILFLKRLLRAGIQINAKDYDGNTAVHVAVSEGNIAAVKVLVKNGKADLSIRDRWNHTVYEESIESNSKNMIQYLKVLDK